MSDITISNDYLSLVASPDKGAGVKAFYIKNGNKEIHIMPDSRRDNCDLKAGSFIMIPYSNRIENGCFSFMGKDYKLKNGEKHSIHGDTRARAWTVKEKCKDKVICTFNSSVYDDVNWPWPFSAKAEYSLSGKTLISKVYLMNNGSSPMPAGFGWHPYFNRSLTQNNEQVLVKFSAEGVYPDANSNCIPSGNPKKPDNIKDFSEEKPLDPKIQLDLCYQGYNGNGYIYWPKSGIKAIFECSPECSHLVFYNPVDKPYFAYEPVTNANNGVNHFGEQGFKSGVVCLNPGETLSASFKLHINS